MSPSSAPRTCPATLHPAENIGRTWRVRDTTIPLAMQLRRHGTLPPVEIPQAPSPEGNVHCKPLLRITGQSRALEQPNEHIETRMRPGTGFHDTPVFNTILP